MLCLSTRHGYTRFCTGKLDQTPETHLISEAGGLADPAEVGRKMVAETMKPNPAFAIYFNFDAWMLSNLTAGMGPSSSFGDVVAQIAGMGIFRVISLFYLNTWWDMLRAYEAPPSSKQQESGKKDYGSTKSD